MQTDLICIDCKHFNGKEFKCKAFPKEIPEVIISGMTTHSKPLAGQDNDIVFEPIEDK